MVRVRDFLRNEGGAATAEYALIMLSVVVVCVAALAAIGTTITGPYSSVAGAFSSTSS